MRSLRGGHVSCLLQGQPSTSMAGVKRVRQEAERTPERGRGEAAEETADLNLNEGQAIGGLNGVIFR